MHDYKNIYEDFFGPEIEGLLRAKKNGNWVLIDYYGNILYDFGAEDTFFLSIGDRCAFEFSASRNSHNRNVYFIDLQERVLYRAPILDIPYDRSLWRQSITEDYIIQRLLDCR